MEEFKTQFQPALLKGDSSRINDGHGRKHYVAWFFEGRRLVHMSRKAFKRATDANQYAHDVLERYRKLVQAALIAFVESQDVAAD